MCGIHAAISRTSPEAVCGTLETCLRNRGPDHIGRALISLGSDGAPVHVALTSTVLALRGDHATPQPLVDEQSGSTLCWNGEAWRIQGKPVEGNDGETVLTMLIAASAVGSEAVLDGLRSIEGPFAFIFADKRNEILYFGRDRLGRRSLLVEQAAAFHLSSISDGTSTGWTEVEADGCYTISLSPSNFSVHAIPTRHAWDSNENLVSQVVNAWKPDANFSDIGTRGLQR